MSEAAQPPDMARGESVIKTGYGGLVAEARQSTFAPCTLYLTDRRLVLVPRQQGEKQIVAFALGHIQAVEPTAEGFTLHLPEGAAESIRLWGDVAEWVEALRQVYPDAPAARQARRVITEYTPEQQRRRLIARVLIGIAVVLGVSVLACIGVVVLLLR